MATSLYDSVFDTKKKKKNFTGKPISMELQAVGGLEGGGSRESAFIQMSQFARCGFK